MVHHLDLKFYSSVRVNPDSGFGYEKGTKCDEPVRDRNRVYLVNSGNIYIVLRKSHVNTSSSSLLESNIFLCT